MNTMAQSLLHDLDSGLAPGVAGPAQPAITSLPSLEHTLAAPIDPSPAPPPEQLGLRARHAASQQGGASARSLSRFGAITKSFPGAEKLRVRKLDEASGLWGPIGDYPLASVKNSQDLEGFMMTFIRPRHHAGRYQVSILDGEGRETRAGDVVLPASPSDGAPQNDTVALRLLETVKETMRMPVPQPVDPIAQFRQVSAIVEEAKARGASGQTDFATIFAAMMQAQMAQAQSQAQMQMQMMQQQAQQQAEMMKLVLAQQAAAPMPPPPMAPPSATENPMFMELMKMAAPVLIKRLLEPEIGTRDIIALLQQRPERSELDMMKSAVDFLRSVQGTEKKESLVEEMTKMQQIKQLAAELVDGGGGGGGSPNANFWDAVAALFANKDFAGSLGKMIGSDIQQRRAPAPQQPGAPTLPAQPRPVGALPQQTVVHNPVPITVAQPQAPQPPVGTRTIVGDKLVIVGANGKRVVFPGNMPAMCQDLAEASQPEDLIQRTTSILYQLRDHEAWKPFVDAVLEETLKNDKENALKALRGWLGMLVQFSLLPIGAAKATLAAFEEHWVSFYTVLAQVMQVPQVAAAPAAPVETPPAVEAPVEAETAPADGESEGESNEEAGAGDESE